MSALTQAITRFLAHKAPLSSHDPSESKITVNEAVGALAFYYEKIRNVVDYQDEHLIRQNAIRRIISRRLIVQNSYEQLAEGLLKELVRFRYFPNNTVPQRMVRSVAQILHLYMGVSDQLRRERTLTDKDQSLLVSIAACAVDEFLVPLHHEYALVDLMYEVMESSVVAQTRGVDDAMRSHHSYIAAYRTLVRPDIHRLRFMLLKRHYPEWTQYENPSFEKLAHEFRTTFRIIDTTIKHPFGKKLLPTFRRFRIAFVVLFAVLRAHPNLVESKDALEKAVRKLCEELYDTQRKKLTGRTIRAFIYIFLTKMLLGLAVELPYDMLTIHEVNKMPLLVNILFPPFLLAGMALSVRLPTEKNTDAIVHAINEVIYRDTARKLFAPQRYTVRRKSVMRSTFFSLLYLVLFGFSFGFVASVLARLQFNIVSGVVFFLFFSLIMFFGINLRRSVQDLIIIKQRTNFLFILVESFFLPIVQVGRWLSFNISRVNIFIFIFDVLIELPLQAIIEITDEWFAFLKEKKDEIDG